MVALTTWAVDSVVRGTGPGSRREIGGIGSSSSGAGRPSLDGLRLGVTGDGNSINESDLYWLAGLLEGEGSFSMNPTRHGRPYPQITVSMTDQDVMEKAGNMMGAPSVMSSMNTTNRHGKLPMWRFSINGMEAIEWMERLQPLMGERRWQKINVILEINSCW